MQDLTTKALILVAGTALGARATYFVQEARYKKILDKEIDSIRAAYAKQDTKEPEVVFVESPPSDNPVPMTRTTPVRKAVRQEFDQITEENGYVNYGRLSKMDPENVFDPELVETWRKAMEPKDELPYVIPAESYSDEYLTYEKNGTVYEAADGKHDDLLMTRAIGLHICFNEMEMPKMVLYQTRVMRKKVSVSAATII